MNDRMPGDKTYLTDLNKSAIKCRQWSLASFKVSSLAVVLVILLQLCPLLVHTCAWHKSRMIMITRLLDSVLYIDVLEEPSD